MLLLIIFSYLKTPLIALIGFIDPPKCGFYFFYAFELFKKSKNRGNYFFWEVFVFPQVYSVDMLIYFSIFEVV
ncbi:hypothetical protein CL659_01075 [bacterium]|nr:hypothetical protein [bacterium]